MPRLVPVSPNIYSLHEFRIPMARCQDAMTGDELDGFLQSGWVRAPSVTQIGYFLPDWRKIVTIQTSLDSVETGRFGRMIGIGSLVVRLTEAVTLKFTFNLTSEREFCISGVSSSIPFTSAADVLNNLAYTALSSKYVFKEPSDADDSLILGFEYLFQNLITMGLKHLLDNLTKGPEPKLDMTAVFVSTEWDVHLD